MARHSMAPALPLRSGTLVLGVFTAAVFLSALLLFAVQPMFARMVLPRLGGSPSVWSVAMVFFQSLLLIGYAYAHLLMQMRQRLLAVTIHIGVLAAAAFMLPLSITEALGTPPASGTALWLFALFAVSIGLPFFALAANNPLLQAWFVRTGHCDGSDPYFLYAASNVGSFLALLSYPLVLEPALTLRTQGQLWTGGFALLAMLITGCAVLLLRSPPDADVARQTDAEVTRPSWPTIGRWIFVSTIPSGLLVAVTAHISTDLTSAPLLWVMPLSLYLLTWVLAFQRRPAFSNEFLWRLQPFAVAWVVALLYLGNRIPVLPSLAGHLLGFFIIAMACHSELARRRPSPLHLTSFYVSLSFGGMVGGLFAGLVAPYIFSWIAEYPILLVLAALCRPLKKSGRYETRFWILAAACAAMLITPTYVESFLTKTILQALDIVVLGLAAVSLVLMQDARKSAAAVLLALFVMRAYPISANHRETVRSFFGVSQIYEAAGGRFRILEHGSTIHGAQQLTGDGGTEVHGRPKLLTYYYDGSPISSAIDAVRARKVTPMRVAVIGLGAGSLACRIARNETWRFFEIDPAVVNIARDPRRFSFISTCAPDLPIVLGDARLTIVNEPSGFYDLIIVDAYSGDAIPVHLATREAMAIYKSKLAQDGAIIMHISNRYLELKSVAVGIAAANGMQTWVWNEPHRGTDVAKYIYPSEVTISAEKPGYVGAVAQSANWTLTAPDPNLHTWTDDYSNIAGAFWRKMTQRRTSAAE